MSKNPNLNISSAYVDGYKIEVEFTHPEKKWKLIDEYLIKVDNDTFIYYFIWTYDSSPGSQPAEKYVKDNKGKYIRYSTDADAVKMIFTSIYIKDNKSHYEPPTEPVNTQRPGGGG